jgi:hypothetical protein
MYPFVQGRSKIRDKNVLSTVMNDLRIQKHQQDLLKGNIRTTILPESAIESENIMEWLDTKELGRYSRLSKETYHIAYQQLKIHKHDRFIIGLYRGFLEYYLKKNNYGFINNYGYIKFYFENDTILEYISIQMMRNMFTTGNYYSKKKENNRSNIVIRNYKKTNENLQIILKQMSDLFMKYNGNMTQEHKFHNYIAKGVFSPRELLFLSTLSGGCSPP